MQQMAQTLLKSCLFDIKTHLKVAAKDWRSNEEGVHQLRVSLRRTMACLDLFSDQFSVAKETRWLQKTLKELLKSAGKARDLDVLLARELPAQGKAQVQLRKAWKGKRKECQKPLDRSFETLVREEKLQAKTRELLKSVSAEPAEATSEATPDLSSWSAQQLLVRIDLLLKKLPEGSQLKGLHSFRVSAKQLRYVAELLQEFHPTKRRSNCCDFWPMFRRNWDVCRMKRSLPNQWLASAARSARNRGRVCNTYRTVPGWPRNPKP